MWQYVILFISDGIFAGEEKKDKQEKSLMYSD